MARYRSGRNEAAVRAGVWMPALGVEGTGHRRPMRCRGLVVTVPIGSLIVEGIVAPIRNGNSGRV